MEHPTVFSVRSILLGVDLLKQWDGGPEHIIKQIQRGTGRTTSMIIEALWWACQHPSRKVIFRASNYYWEKEITMRARELGARVGIDPFRVRMLQHDDELGGLSEHERLFTDHYDGTPEGF
jgi:hypothetical protein